MKDFDQNFDGQKLMFHPREVAEWLDAGRTSGPLYTEMELTRRCNCRCIFCGVDHQVNQGVEEMPLALAQKIISGLAAVGNKALMLCGHGEPLLNPEVVAIANFAADRMSVSMTTNGVALNQERLPLIDRLEWLRFSVNGGNAESYGVVHNIKPETFALVLNNIGMAVDRKRKLGLPVTIGVQLVLLPENAASVLELAHRVRDLGVGYFTVKPYSQHPLSINRRQIDYRDYLEVQDKLLPLKTPDFKVIFRGISMQRVGHDKAYGQCFGSNFIAFVSANGDLWGCNVFAGDPRFYIGNIGQDDLNLLWGDSRQERVRCFIENDLDLSECRDLCRMDSCNRYLWRLKNPWAHDNFI